MSRSCVFRPSSPLHLIAPQITIDISIYINFSRSWQKRKKPKKVKVSYRKFRNQRRYRCVFLSLPIFRTYVYILFLYCVYKVPRPLCHASIVDILLLQKFGFRPLCPASIVDISFTPKIWFSSELRSDERLTLETSAF